MNPRRQATTDPITVGRETIEPGTRRRIELTHARLATGSPIGVPIEVVHGARPGPRVFLSSTVHGDELNGIEIIRRVLADLSPRRMAGTVIAVPIVNVLGFLSQSRYLPDRRDLNRSFPGSRRGSLAAQLAHLVMQEVVAGCRYGIDLHTGSDGRTNLPQIRADLSDPETLRLAHAFGAPVAIHASVRDGSLRAAAAELGARVLVYEGGEAHRFTRLPVEVGTRGILRVFSALEMRGAAATPEEEAPVVSKRSVWVRAGRSGLARLDVEPGTHVQKGRSLGMIRNALEDGALRVRARTEGIVIGVTRRALVNRGDALVHIAEVHEGELFPSAGEGVSAPSDDFESGD